MATRGVIVPAEKDYWPDGSEEFRSQENAMTRDEYLLLLTQTCGAKGSKKQLKTD